jgi:hypothetical protein
MHFVVNHVAQLHHVNDADCCRLIEFLPGSTIEKESFSKVRNTGFFCVFIDLIQGCSVKNRG